MSFTCFTRAQEEGTAINRCELAVSIELDNSNYGIPQKDSHFFLSRRVGLTKVSRNLGVSFLKSISWISFPSIYLFRPNKVVLDKPHGVLQNETSSYPTWLIAR